MYGWSIKTETLILSILTLISFILSIVAVAISMNISQTSTTITNIETESKKSLSTNDDNITSEKTQMLNNNKTAVFNNGDIILETETNLWKFGKSAFGGLCFYSTKKDDNVDTNYSCIETLPDSKELNLINFAR